MFACPRLGVSTVLGSCCSCDCNCSACCCCNFSCSSRPSHKLRCHLKPLQFWASDWGVKTARLAAPPLVIGAWLFIAASALAAAFGVGWRLRCWVCVFGQVNSESPSPSSSFSVLPSLSIPFVVIHASHVPFCRILLQFFPHFVFLFSSSFFVSFSRTFIRTFCFYFCIRQPFVKVDFFVCFPCNFCTYTFVFIFFFWMATTC